MPVRGWRALTTAGWRSVTRRSDRSSCFSECIIVTMSDESTANDGWSCHENCVPPLPYIDARRPLA